MLMFRQTHGEDVSNHGKVGENIIFIGLACACSWMKWTWLSMCLFYSWNLGFSVTLVEIFKYIIKVYD
jgi:hypothetical protein